jgi:hypothetical protein
VVAKRRIAPIYKEYWLAVELQSVEKTTVLRIPADLTMLPGDAVVDKSLLIPQDLPPGTYRFRVALLDPKTSQPAVLLAIKGRQPDGWYDLGSVELKP